MTPPICGMPISTHPELTCENPPTCSLPVPTLVEDEQSRTSRVVEVRHCAEELSRMSPPPALYRRLHQLARRHYQFEWNPHNRPSNGNPQAAAPTPPASQSPSVRPHPAPPRRAPQSSGMDAGLIVTGAIGGAVVVAAGALGRAAGRALRALGR